jgi:hypothetical protein
MVGPGFAAAGAGTGGGQAPSAAAGGAGVGAGLPDLSGLAGMNLPDLGMMGGGGGGGLFDPATMQQMLQNPQIQQMMQGLLSNPAYMNQVSPKTWRKPGNRTSWVPVLKES